MSEPVTWQGPVKPYIWGMTYEIRDAVNRTVIRAVVMKGDIAYRKNLEKLVRNLADLMNGTKWVENGTELISFGAIETQLKAEASEVAAQHEPEPISSSVDEEKRKPGRPKKK